MKSVLVVNTPKDCYECPCSNEGCYLCQINRRQLEDDFQERRPEWCPLKPLPEKKEHEEEIDYDYGYIDGWNDCISTMSGEEENNGLRPLKDDSHEYYGCPSCLHIVSSVQNYCENCGQKLDWRNVGETE